jgi:schlafen family protein
MALLHIPLEQIAEAHLRQLITDGAAESLYIDYKRATYGAADRDRAEFLADVSSFANTVGGDVVLGVTETNGVPAGFVALNINAEAERLRLEQMARTGLEPRIANLKIRAVPIQQGGAALIIRIPRSYNPPHRVIYGGRNRFWARSSAGKYEPNVEELRQLFNAAPQLADRIRSFRNERVHNIQTGRTPVATPNSPLLILHLVPYSAFDIGRALNLSDVQGRVLSFPPLGRREPSNWRINLDGLVTTSPTIEGGHHHAYAQIFRSGAVESVTTEERGMNGGILTSAVDALVVPNARMLLGALHASGVEPPIAATVSLVRGRSIQADGDGPRYPIDNDPLLLTEVVFEAIPTDNNEVGRIMRPLLDQLANAAGRISSPSFDAQGNFRPFL